MISCRIFEMIVSNCLDADSALPKFALKHVQNCSKCRTYYENTKTLTCDLASSAPVQKHAPPPFLHTRIMGVVRSQHSAPGQHQPARLAWALALGTACLVAVGLWFRTPIVPTQNLSDSTPISSQQASAVNLPSVAQVGQWTQNLDVPLQQETKLVLSDANAALNTLVRNFLPKDLLASSTETTQHKQN
jgi:hypothetical protein